MGHQVFEVSPELPLNIQSETFSINEEFCREEKRGEVEKDFTSKSRVEKRNGSIPRYWSYLIFQVYGLDRY